MSEDIKQIRILAVDDHPVLRQGIAALIVAQSDMTLVAEGRSGTSSPSWTPRTALTPP
jgi:DNA-binding NarL/FixJ family response regulator